MIKTEAPTVKRFAALAQLDEAVAKHIIDSGTKFVCSYNGKDLEGVLWYVGTGTTWWTTGIRVIDHARGSDIGTKLRMRMIAECEKVTLGKGTIYGVYPRKTEPFWKSIKDTRTNAKLVVGERKIVGKA